MNNTILYFHTLQTVHLPLAFLSHLSSLLPFLKTIPKTKQKKNSRTVGTSHKKVFKRKTSTCRDETLKNQPNKMGTTPQHIHAIVTSPSSHRHCRIARPPRPPYYMDTCTHTPCHYIHTPYHYILITLSLTSVHILEFLPKKFTKNQVYFYNFTKRQFSS